jgi:beta-galactosidase/beta-glucuronidase
MKILNMRYLRFSALGLLLALATSCSHKFDSNVLDLNFYQWNLWPDTDANPEEGGPGCGWEELHRGTGKLVRIPALVQDHFPGEGGAEVYWYHCRFTLPEHWEDKEVSLRFESVGPFTEVYLNQDPVGSHRGEQGEFEIDVSEVIYYTRDNHLAIKVSLQDGSNGAVPVGAGIAGSVQARIKKDP